MVLFVVLKRTINKGPYLTELYTTYVVRRNMLDSTVHTFEA